MTSEAPPHAALDGVGISGNAAVERVLEEMRALEAAREAREEAREARREAAAALAQEVAAEQKALAAVQYFERLIVASHKRVDDVLVRVRGV